MTNIKRSSICIAFMAHNENHETFRVLREKLGDRISSWCAVADTDEVVASIGTVFSDLPGTLHRLAFPQTNGFMDFAKARNRMLDLARRQNTDYVLWLDPDDPLDGQIPDQLTKPVYAVRHVGPGSEWVVSHFIRYDAKVRWAGQVHEHLEGDSGVILDEDLSITRTTSGSATNNLVETQFIPLLCTILEKDKTNKHAWFYLAQSYHDVGRDADAAAAYAHRATLGGWAPIVYWCYFQIAEITGSVDDYLIAYNFRPSRTEALHRLAVYYNGRGLYSTSKLFSSIGLDVPPTQDAMFVERWGESYGLLMELAISQDGLGEREQAQRIREYVLTLDDVQPQHRVACERKLMFKAAA